MARVLFTSNLHRFTGVAETEAAGATLREVLDALDAAVRHYLVDDRGELRRHVAVFVDGERAEMDAALAPGATVHVMQAPSGG